MNRRSKRIRTHMGNNALRDPYMTQKEFAQSEEETTESKKLSDSFYRGICVVTFSKDETKGDEQNGKRM